MPVPEREVLSPSRPTVALLACLLLTAGATGLDAQAPQHDPIVEALGLLHDGRFDQADALLASSPATAEDPSFAFFRAFVSYWRLLYDDQDTALRERFDGQLDAAIALADARLDADLPDAEAALWGGSARLFLAQLKVLQKKTLGAAFEAKRAKKLLEAASRSKPDNPDPLFGLGLYNYVADRLPAFVKGLRALLFLPGGNRELGLRQLERAAAESRHFGLEARVLLLTLYSAKTERLYDQELREMNLLIRDNPDPIAVKDAVARTLLSLGDIEGAVPYIDAGLGRADTIGGVDDDVRGTLLGQRALADYLMFRPDLARPRAAAILEQTASFPKDVRDQARTLVEGADAILSSETWSIARDAIQATDAPVETTAARLLELSQERPEDAVLALIAGRALLRAGNAVPAAELLVRAEASGRLSPSWIGICRLLAGEAFDLAGNRARALAYYHRSVDSPSFIAKDGAYYRQARPYRGERP